VVDTSKYEGGGAPVVADDSTISLPFGISTPTFTPPVPRRFDRPGIAWNSRWSPLYLSGPGETGTTGVMAGQNGMSGARNGYAYQFYVDGDQLAPVGYSPETIARMQRKLIQAGLLDPKEVSKFGVWTRTEAQAYEAVLSHANLHGQSASQALSWLSQNPPEAAKDTGQGQSTPLIYRLPNARDVARTADDVASATLGRKLTDEERSQFVSAYMQTVRSSQYSSWAVSQQQDAAMAGGASAPFSLDGETAKGAAAAASAPSVYDAPSMNTAAADFAQRSDPGGVEAHGAADFYAKLLDTIGVNYG